MKNIAFFFCFLILFISSANSQDYLAIYKIGATEKFLDRDYGDEFVNDFARLGFEEIFNNWKLQVLCNADAILLTSDASTIGYEDTVIKYGVLDTSKQFVTKADSFYDFPSFYLDLKKQNSYTIYSRTPDKIDSVIMTGLKRHSLQVTDERKVINGYECQRYIIYNKEKNYEVTVWISEQVPVVLNPYGFINAKGGVIRIEYVNGLFQELISYNTADKPGWYPNLGSFKAKKINVKNDFIASWHFFNTNFNRKLYFE